MKNWKVKFSNSSVSFVLDGSFSAIDKIVDKSQAIYITDENVYALHQKKFKGKKTIVIPAGEEYKQQATVDFIIEALLNFGATRQSILVGVGGGVVTDMVGYVAGIYMRGVAVGFVPTTILAMVDASIGGKNGIDVGLYKNMVGLIRQPQFLVYDLEFLKSLPQHQWENGFAEIIKHGAVLDAKLFKQLSGFSLQDVQQQQKLFDTIVRTNVALKSAIVKKDEFEKGDRKLLNFGHTLGHALETQYELTHGQAVALGMVFAAWLSEKLLGFKNAALLEQVLVQFGLPTRAVFDVERVFKILQMDKKRLSKHMRFVLLSKLGKGQIVEIPLTTLKKQLVAFNSLNKKQK